MVSGLIHPIILAAGRGSRLGGDVPKPLVQIGHKSLVGYALDSLELVQKKCSKPTVVVGHEREQVIKHIEGKNVDVVIQDDLNGPGGGVKLALDSPKTKEKGNSFLAVMADDSVWSDSRDIRSFLEEIDARGLRAGVMLVADRDPFGHNMGFKIDDNKCLLEGTRDVEDYELDNVGFSAGITFSENKLFLDGYEKIRSDHEARTIDVLEQFTLKQVDVLGFLQKKEFVSVNTPEGLARARQVVDARR